jgi:hypothetical protein
MTSLTDVVCQPDQGVTRPVSDLQHPLACGSPERLKAKVTGGVLARIGNEIVRATDPIIEVSRAATCRSS